MTAAEYTPEQKVLLKFLDTVIHLSPKDVGREMVNSKISNLLIQYPFASEVKTHLEQDRVIIDEADAKIEQIVGYKPCELVGKPLGFIMGVEMNQKQLQKTVESLEKYGVCVKSNTNKRKDGSLVKTFGWIFKVGKNDYREVVMDAKHVIGYDVK